MTLQRGYETEVETPNMYIIFGRRVIFCLLSKPSFLTKINIYTGDNNNNSKAQKLSVTAFFYHCIVKGKLHKEKKYFKVFK